MSIICSSNIFGHTLIMTEFEPFYLGRYKILEELGRGAMGVVYKGLDTVLVRVVAIKTIRVKDPSTPLTDEDILEIFLREAKIAGNLTHPNITAIYDIGFDQGTHFFVMEYVEGSTVEQLIGGGEPMPLLVKLRILSSVARALHYAHVRNVIHRDIKPANVMILRNMEPKIMDFGVARLKAGRTDDRVENDRIFGTPHYMSPEQLERKEIDHKTDIFSLGVLAYEFLSGRKPFDGDSLSELLRSIVGDTPEPLDAVDPSMPKELNEIILHALQKEKARRFDHCSHFADALELLISKLETARPGVMANGRIASDKKRVIDGLKKNYTFFADFSDDEIIEIFKLSAKEVFEPGQVIFEEGTTGAKMYVIIDGKVKITQRDASGTSRDIKTFGEGDCFGEMAIIDNSPRSASATAMCKATVVAINEIVLRVARPELCVKLYKNLSSIMAERLRDSTKKLRAVLDSADSGLA